MLGLGMMLGEGRPAFTVELNNNRTQWSVLADAPQLSVGGPITLTLIVGPNINITSNGSTSSTRGRSRERPGRPRKPPPGLVFTPDGTGGSSSPTVPGSSTPGCVPME
jgi:hypothetical protein